MPRLKFYSDIGHAWLEVPMTLINELGIKRKITKYSYKQGNFAYLEEDVDAHIFMDAYKKRHNKNIEFVEKDHGISSPIRNYTPFTIA